MENPEAGVRWPTLGRKTEGEVLKPEKPVNSGATVGDGTHRHTRPSSEVHDRRGRRGCRSQHGRSAAARPRLPPLPRLELPPWPQRCTVSSQTIHAIRVIPDPPPPAEAAAARGRDAATPPERRRTQGAGHRKAQGAIEEGSDEMNSEAQHNRFTSLIAQFPSK